MKNSEVNNKHKKIYGNLKTILSIWYFKCKRFTDTRLMKQNPEYVHMEELNNGELTTSKLMIQW